MTLIAVVFADAVALPKDSHWLEQLSQISTIVLATAALLALWQVRAAIKQAKAALEQNRIALEQLKLTASQLEIARADIVLRSRREAIAVALEQFFDWQFIKQLQFLAILSLRYPNFRRNSAHAFAISGALRKTFLPCNLTEISCVIVSV
jgi:hypothetical protein